MAQEKPKRVLRDTLDNAFDISYYLYNLHGLLPVVAPITEPAVGYGAALAALYFIPKKEVKKGEFRMPDVATAFGAYTSNNTWLAGAAYMGFWRKDRIRYRGIFGYGDVKLKYYGTGPFNSNKSIRFSLESFIFIQQATFRIAGSNFFIGGKYQLSKTKVKIQLSDIFPELNPFDFNMISSGLSLITEFENFDNLFTPTKGVRVYLGFDQNMKALGSDRDFGRLTFYTHMFFPVGGFWIPGFRIESLMSTGDAPFYALPFVQLRGIPALRYQGEFTMLVETEQLFNIGRRWGVLAFGGVGTAITDIDDFEFETTAWNVGGGFRYLIARQLGLKMGIDVARGDEDWAFYIVFGYSWGR